MTVTTADDRIETYFALRTMEIKAVDGIQRVCLNGKPVFLHGILDQGYFPEGIYLPAEEAEYDRDILRMKELGFNPYDFGAAGFVLAAILFFALSFAITYVLKKLRIFSFL
jgi:hypothetical protein